MCIKLYSVYGYTFYMIIGSVVFQVMFSERETKCPRLKEKYTNHVDLTPLKTQPESPGSVSLCGRQVGGAAGPRTAQRPSPSLRPVAVSSSMATGQQQGWHSPCPPTWRSLFVRSGRLNFISFSWSEWNKRFLKTQSVLQLLKCPCSWLENRSQGCRVRVPEVSLSSLGSWYKRDVL